MLSISAMSGGQGAYYTTLAREDYYLSGGEPPGIWTGRGAEALKFSGQVDKEELARLFAGFSPKDDNALVQNAGADTHRPGWDLTFSAPKSVSVLWSQADGPMANEIRAAQQDSVEKAITYLEDNAAFTRRGKAGHIHEQAKLLVSTFEHGTSRAQDPQLHTHALVLNVAVRADGTTGSIEPKSLYQHKMAAGAIYRAELSYQLQQRLGIETERSGTCFEVKGVPAALTKEFSKRRAEIEEALDKKGFTSSKAAEMAAVSSRDVKEHKPREELLKGWQEIGKTFGFSTDQAQKLAGRIVPHTDLGLSQFRQAQAVKEAVEQITKQTAHFPERDLVRFAAQEAQGRGVSSANVLEAVRMKMASGDLVRLKREPFEERFTTPEMLKIERHLIDTAKDHGKAERHKVRDGSAIQSAFDRMPLLSDEQKDAVIHLTATTGGVAVVTGMAGTGKTTMLKTCADIWKKKGFQVLGTCLSGKAADGLESGAKIPSFTVARLLMELDKPESLAKVTLTRDTVLVLDEAGMVGTRQMDQIMTRVSQASAKIVMVGDARQLQPIDAGGPFAALGRELGEAKLTEIRRQKDSWMREVVKDVADGRSSGALEALAEAGNLRVCKDRNEAMQQLLMAWEVKGIEKPDSNLIIASTNEDAKALNRDAQEKRYAAGMLGNKPVKVNGESFYVGDRIMFTRNSAGVGVKNGNIGTVTRIAGSSLTVEVDSKFRTFSVKDYEHLSLGYAVTTHRAQGVTTDNAFLLTNEMMQDRELSYVQVSRARNSTVMFTTAAEAGNDLADLARTMHRSRQKDLASDLLPSFSSQAAAADFGGTQSTSQEASL